MLHDLTSAAPVLTVDVCSDIICPWCFVGTRRLDRVLEALRAERSQPIPVTFRHHPFLLDPSIPPEGRDVQAELRRKYGRDPAQLFAMVEAQAREEGIPLDLGRQPRAHRTLGAHTLLRHAAAKGTQRALLDALFRAHFLEARDVSSPEVLGDIAAEHGITREEAARLVHDPAERRLTESDIEDAVAGGVTGVPTFVLGGRLALTGAQPAPVFRAALLRALDDAA